MALTNAKVGEKKIIRLMNCERNQRMFLESLGLCEGGCVTVLNKFCGSIIVSTSGSQCALSNEMAGKIIL